MILPSRLQLFTTKVILSDKDAARLTPFLASSRSLVPVIADMNEPDLQRLIVLELLNGRRWVIVSRLLGRLGAMQREELAVRMWRLCK